MADNTKQQVDQSFFVFVKDTNTGKIRRIAIPGDVQIGLQGNPAELQLLGRLSLSTIDYNVTAINKGVLYVSNNDTIVSVSLQDAPASGRITVYLPSNPRNGQLHFIKDKSGTAGSVPIDIVPPRGVLIDQYVTQTLSDQFGSLAIYWLGDQWHILVSGVSSASSPTTSDATYLTLSNNVTLTNERRLNLSGTNLTLTDQGPNASAIIDLTQILSASSGTYTYATITADVYGRITAVSSGIPPSPNNASYVTLTNDPFLSAERRLVVGTGLRLFDSGANSSVTLSTPWTESPTIVSTTSSVTLGPGITNFSLTGPYIGPVLLITSSNQVGFFVDGPAAGAGAGMQLRATDRTSWELLSTADTSAQGANKFNIRNVTLTIDCFTILSSGFTGIRNTNPQAALDVNGDINIGGNTRSLFFNGTSGSIRIAKVGNNLKFFDTYNAAGLTLSQLGGADVSASYIIIGNTGSLPNERSLVAGAGITLTDGGPGGTLTITNTGTPGSGADVSASYLTINNTGSLPNERVVVAGYGINFQDGGANDKLIISFAGSTSGSSGGGGGADVSASYVLIGNTGSLPNERALTAGSGITITDNGPNNTVVIAATGGGGGTTIIVSGTAAFGQAAYQGFTTSSVFWSVTSSWTPFTGALGNYTDTLSASVVRNGSNFQTANGGLYYFHAGFNAYGSDAYVSMRLRNTTSNVVALQRATYRTNFADQNLVELHGIFSATNGDTWALEYVTSGTILPWTSSNPTPDGTNMWTGAVSMFLLPTSPGAGVMTQTGSYVAPDASDYLWWPMTDTIGPNVLNFGTAGASGNMTASSATAVHFNQVGPLRNSIGTNVAGATLGYINILNTATQPTPNSSSISVSAWFRPENIVGSLNVHQKIVLKSFYNTTATWNSPFIAITLGMAGTVDGKMEYGFSGLSAGPTLVASGGSCTQNEWNHAGLTYDGAAMRCYLNGVMIYQTACTGVIDYSQNGWWALGGNPALTSEYFQGQIADVRVANTVRSASWFQQVWNSGRPDASPYFQLTGSGGAAKAPIFSTPFLAGTVTTNTAHSASKQSLGMAFFNPQTIQNFGGASRRYFYRAIVDATSIETNMSAAIDLYDLNGIVAFPPGIITGSIMSSSSGTSVQLQADLTTLLQNVSGSGIFEARLWRTVSGTLASSVACRNARLDVEFS